MHTLEINKNDNLPYWIVPVKIMIHSKAVRTWCKLPYPGHKHGCPMYGKKDGCPPNVPYVTEVLDLDKPVWFVYSEFDLSAHVGNMRAKHPLWSERQLRCCLYWQRKSRNQLLHRVCEAKGFYVNANFYTLIPEALGINVYRTCGINGVKLEPIRTLKTCRHVAFLGSKVE